MSATLSPPAKATRRASDLQVTPVRTWRDRRDFMRLAWRLYHDDPNWVPPLRMNLKQLVGWKHHPFQEIAEVQTAFVEGTKRALAAGYEWLELHAAHGYLAHQFLSPISNQRIDLYGGSFENRIRFLLETVRVV